MLVVLSDLHFEEEASNHIPGDGNHPPIEFKRNLPATPYRLLIEQLAGEAQRNAAQKLEFVLAGDIFDLHRSGRWFRENEHQVRPYVSNPQISPELEAFTLRLFEGIINEDHVKDVLPLFRLLAGGRYLDSAQKEHPFPVPVELHYIPGNHDRLANASPVIRKAMRGALGLAEHGAAFPNALAFDSERALVRHGHEYDYTNFSVSLYGEEAIPIHLPVHYYQDPAFGDLATVDIASQLPTLFRQYHGDETILADQTLRALYLRLLEFDDLRPLTAIFNYFIYADGQTIDKQVAWEAIVPVVIELLENIHDDPYLLYWLDRFDQPWRLDLIDAVQAILAANRWILGHLAICPELGELYCGVDWRHPLWKERFGPGSSDDVPDAASFSKDELVDAILQGYPRMHQTVSSADPSTFEKPHGLALLDGTPIKTSGDLVAHLLTSHFAFHLAQLSGWRRSAGHGPLF